MAELGARARAQAIRARQLGAVEATQATLDAIEASQPTINAFTEVLAEQALRDAAAIDRGQGPRHGPLLGVPLAVKDNIDTAVGSTTHGSAGLRGHRAGRDAEVVARLRQAGCIVVGKTTMPELALRATTESSAYGITRNPRDPTRTPGGSSGGSAAAVAAGLVPLALGNDAGGSVRIPASWCGVVGVKPSRGRFSWLPARRESWGGLATHGLLAADVADAALAFDVVARPADPRAASAAVATAGELRVLVAVRGPLGPVAEQARVAALDAAAALAHAGLDVEHGTPRLDGLLDAFLTIGSASTVAEAPQAMDWGRAEPYTCEVARAAAGIGRVALAAAYDTVARRTAEIVAFWDRCDVLVTPAMSIPAPPIEDRPDDPARWRRYLEWAQFLFPFNVSGQPAVTIPWSVPGCDLPLGVQLVGRPGDDALLLEVAATLSSRSPWRP
jgi:amidase